jgi:hypothetical protein
VDIAGKEYTFASQHMNGDILVDNFIIVPGHYVRDMDAVGRQTGDFTRRFYGAAQVQLVFNDPSRWPVEERREAASALIGAYSTLLEEIRMGGQP